MEDDLRSEYNLKSLRVRKLGSGRKSFGETTVRLEPDMDYAEEYQKHLTILSLLTREAFELNIYLSNTFNNRMDNLSNENLVFLSIFSKIALNANSILSILPKDDPRKLYGTENFKVVDLSSVASITRNIIEASNTLFYLFAEKVENSERQFRFFLFGLHGWLRQKELVEFVGGSNQVEMLAHISKQIDIFKAKIEANSFFINLNEEEIKKTQKGQRSKSVFRKNADKKVENVKDSMFLTHREIAEIRGFSPSLFDAIYRFLSNQTHPFLMGTSLVGPSIALDEKSFLLLLLTIKNAALYLGLTMIDTTMVFQWAREKLSPESTEILERMAQGGF